MKGAVLCVPDLWNEAWRTYAMEHRTRPATIGFAIASSPVALLAWVRVSSLHSCVCHCTLNNGLDQVVEKWV